MTGLQTLRHGSENQNPAQGGGPARVFEKGGLAFRRYLLVSSGISSTALGLALIVSFLAAGYGEPAIQRLAVSEASSAQVVIRGEHASTSLLEQAAATVAMPEPVPEVARFAPAPLAPVFNIEPRTEPSQGPTSPPTAPATASPKAAIVPPGVTPTLPPPKVSPTPSRAQVQPPAALVTFGKIDNVNLTFYDCLDQGFCGTMKSGTKVYEGAAACSWNLPEGTKFRIVHDPTGRTYVCEDRGILDDTWVDIFFRDPKDGWKWQEAVGRYGTIEIIKLP